MVELNRHGSEPDRPLTCSAEEKRCLLVIARDAIQAAIQARPLPEPAAGSLTADLSRPAATFVTLDLGAKLRGCVGNLIARDPLHRSVRTNAVGAALRDARFNPVTLDESMRMGIHISILSPLIPLQSGSGKETLDQLTPGVDGVVLRHAGRTATYLPQVWNRSSSREDFLESLCHKAGLGDGAWKEVDAEILRYRVSGFGDTEVG